MQDDHGHAAGAHRLRLPVAVAQHLAAHLVSCFRRHLHQLRFRRRQRYGSAFGTREEITRNGLKMAVAQKTTRVERLRTEGLGTEGLGTEGLRLKSRLGLTFETMRLKQRRTHAEPSRSAAGRMPRLAVRANLVASVRKAVALRAPVGSSSCRK